MLYLCGRDVSHWLCGQSPVTKPPCAVLKPYCQINYAVMQSGFGDN